MWSERWGESGMRSIEMKQNSGGQRDTEQWHSCEWQRLGDQSGEYSRGGGVCFWCGERRSDTSSAGVTEDYRLGGLQSTPAMTSADDARLLGCLNAVILKVQWFNLTAAGRFSKRHHSWTETVDNNFEKQATALSYMQIKPIWSAVLYITQLKEV